MHYVLIIDRGLSITAHFSMAGTTETAILENTTELDSMATFEAFNRSGVIIGGVVGLMAFLVLVVLSAVLVLAAVNARKRQKAVKISGRNYYHGVV